MCPNCFGIELREAPEFGAHRRIELLGLDPSRDRGLGIALFIRLTGRSGRAGVA
jgi:hypothetical protein